MKGQGLSEEAWERADAWHDAKCDRIAKASTESDLIIISGNRQDVFGLSEIIETLNESCGSDKPLSLEEKQEIRTIFETLAHADFISVEEHGQ